MRFWLSGPRMFGGLFRPGVGFGPEDFRRRRRPSASIIVLEQHADPVELVYQAFLRLDSEQRARLRRRVESRWRG
jgi:hypothetical protein